MNRRAFTLVELLVVIAIIGLLSTVAAVSLSSSRSKARNAKRVADVKQFLTAFNLANSVSGYPVTTDWVCVSTSCFGGWSTYTASSALDTIMFGSGGYMGSKPTDPPDPTRGIGGYLYTSVWPGGGSYSGGVTFTYMIEGAIPCPIGTLWSQTANYTQCVVAVDSRF